MSIVHYSVYRSLAETNKSSEKRFSTFFGPWLPVEPLEEEEEEEEDDDDDDDEELFILLQHDVVYLQLRF